MLITLYVEPEIKEVLITELLLVGFNVSGFNAKSRKCELHGHGKYKPEILRYYSSHKMYELLIITYHARVRLIWTLISQ